MKLYHGTTLSSAMNIMNFGVDLGCSQPMLDFGKGFYTTPNKEYAIKTAKNKTFKFNRKHNMNEIPAVIEFVYTKHDDMNIKVFNQHDDSWMQFVLANRMDLNTIGKYNITEHNLDCKYDIVDGEIADGSITQISYRIRNNEITPSDIDIKELLQKDGFAYGYQVSFHTQKSLDCIEYKNCDIIR